MSTQTIRIVGGIEWFTLSLPSGGTETEPACARCGSSVGWNPCGNCDDGIVERPTFDDYAERDPKIVSCDWCSGAGGSYHCLSSRDYCEANPIQGREHIESTALRAEAWND